jgi:hypothetical protein
MQSAMKLRFAWNSYFRRPVGSVRTLSALGSSQLSGRFSNDGLSASCLSSPSSRCSSGTMALRSIPAALIAAKSLEAGNSRCAFWNNARR